MLGTALYARKPISLIRTDNPLQTMVWATAIAGGHKAIGYVTVVWHTSAQ
jgi:hypothetical protein